MNAVGFYLVFPSGLLENYVYPRPETLVGYAIAAIVSAAMLLTIVYAAVPTMQPWPRGAAFGALVGLLASAPERLALFAVVRSNSRHEIIIVCWTACSWGIAGLAISWFLTREESRGADRPEQTRD